jgi:hypothetical protein
MNQHCNVSAGGMCFYITPSTALTQVQNTHWKLFFSKRFRKLCCISHYFFILRTVGWLSLSNHNVSKHISFVFKCQISGSTHSHRSRLSTCGPQIIHVPPPFKNSKTKEHCGLVPTFNWWRIKSETMQLVIKNSVLFRNIIALLVFNTAEQVSSVRSHWINKFMSRSHSGNGCCHSVLNILSSRVLLNTERVTRSLKRWSN